MTDSGSEKSSTNTSEKTFEQEGYLELHIGPMCSGKTQLLLGKLMTVADLDSRFRVLYINHAIDKRAEGKEQKEGTTQMTNGDENVTTHRSQFHGLSKKITKMKIHNLADANKIISNFDFIGIDEMHFFPDLVETVSKWVDHYRKHVICVGLDGKSNREPWLNVCQLIALSDKCVKTVAFCKKCADEKRQIGIPGMGPLIDAPFTHCFQKRTNTDEPLVGGLETYVPVCRRHYLELNPI